MGRRPLRRENARPLGEQALGSRGGAIERSCCLKDGRARVGRDARLWSSGGRAREVKRPRRAAWPRPELITRVATRGAAGLVGGSRRGAGTKPMGFVEKREGGEGTGKPVLDHRVGAKL